MKTQRIHLITVLTIALVSIGSLLVTGCSAFAPGGPTIVPTIQSAPTLAPGSFPTVELVTPEASPTGSTATPEPSATSMPETSPVATSALGACQNNARFVLDVTVPDGTVLASGQAFNKIWRMDNTGSCTWGPGYNLEFVGGESMGAETVIPVPTAALQSTVDLLVAMKAPTTAGTHHGLWRLRAPDGTYFGDELDVLVNVVAPPVKVACSGTPIITSFTASSITIPPGGSATLRWGLVGNADIATIDHGIGGVATPGSITVSPTTTTTYTLTGLCGSQSTVAQVTIAVVSPTATPTLLTTATPTPLPPTATSTPLPPTATSTPLPPTATPTRTHTPTPH